MYTHSHTPQTPLTHMHMHTHTHTYPRHPSHTCTCIHTLTHIPNTPHTYAHAYTHTYPKHPSHTCTCIHILKKTLKHTSHTYTCIHTLTHTHFSITQYKTLSNTPKLYKISWGNCNKTSNHMMKTWNVWIKIVQISEDRKITYAHASVGLK